MKRRAYFQQAFVNLSAAKVRSFLAMLGILVGTAAVVALISCGELATEKALEQFKALGTDLLAVSVYAKTPSKSQSESPDLSLSQWQGMAERIPSVLSIAPYSTVYQSISFQGKVLQGVVIGADDALATTVSITLAQGNFVSFLASFEHFCVIGDGLAQQIQSSGLDSPLGKQLRIGQALYTIIGIAAPWKENAFFNEDINRAVIVPLGGIHLIGKEARINNAVLQLKPNSPIEFVSADITQFLSEQVPHRGVFLRSAKQIIASMESQGRIFTLLLAVIGSIALLVGGIGVMNVMLVSVSERKKEIGIRKAVGAKDYEIQTLFLIEALLLALLGGVMGVILGLLFTFVVAIFSGWTFTVYLIPVVLGFLVSGAVGVFFGFYPARRAAKVDPVISLRGE